MSVALLIVIVAFAVTLSLGLPKLREKRAQYLRGEFIESDAEESVFSSAAIVVDGEPCARIGKDVSNPMQFNDSYLFNIFNMFNMNIYIYMNSIAIS